MADKPETSLAENSFKPKRKELMETSQYSIGGFSNLGWQLYMGRIKSLLFNICWIALIFLPSSREVKDNIQLPSKR
jgi:hypothetical protein